MRVCVNVNGDADPTARGLIADSGSIETARGLEGAAPFDDHKAAFLRHLASTIVRKTGLSGQHRQQRPRPPSALAGR